MSIGPPILRMLRGVLFVYVVVMTWAWFFSDRLIFIPPRPTYRDTARIMKIAVRGSGETISAIHLPSPGAPLTVLYSHGNGNDLGQLEGLLDELHRHGFAVLAYDYEGYGTSTGSPSEPALYRDADAAYEYLTTTLGVRPEHVLLHGFSLGGAAAVELAAHHPVAGVVLESTFVTAFRVRTGIPLVPFDRFDNLSKMPSIDRPLLILHSEDDGLIAPWHARALLASARSRSKSLVVFDRGGHGGAVWTEPELYWQTLERFAASVGAATDGAASGSAFVKSAAIFAPR